MAQFREQQQEKEGRRPSYVYGDHLPPEGAQNAAAAKSAVDAEVHFDEATESLLLATKRVIEGKTCVSDLSVLEGQHIGRILASSSSNAAATPGLRDEHRREQLTPFPSGQQGGALVSQPGDEPLSASPKTCTSSQQPVPESGPISLLKALDGAVGFYESRTELGARGSIDHAVTQEAAGFGCTWSGCRTCSGFQPKRDKASCCASCGHGAMYHSRPATAEVSSFGGVSSPAAGRSSSSTATAEKQFLVDNSLLHATTEGLGYRRTPVIEDYDARIDPIARWGTTVVGTLHGDSWLRVISNGNGTPASASSCYLPLEVRGTPAAASCCYLPLEVRGTVVLRAQDVVETVGCPWVEFELRGHHGLGPSDDGLAIDTTHLGEVIGQLAGGRLGDGRPQQARSQVLLR